MTRVFTGLALGNLLVLLGTAALGFLNPDATHSSWSTVDWHWTRWLANLPKGQFDHRI